ncbi:uncharacterized protein LOC126575568 isoform X2 [Anopheles aquasalis]|uniref:uncharacterized protein LOC126575568 isoform X2 n=1 Tax=Anopheles aquasalis TaxID=42839 RepID=UPI00215A141C|nr:uncharacterized protein LOC126575568 isoform X2 [Anopheles aquasalis]
MTSSSYNKEQLAAKLYSSIKPFVFYSQLLCSVPYPVATLQSSCHLSFVYRSNFKQARCLLTAALMICIIICNLMGVIQMASIPMPFFTTTLYINEIALCAIVSLLTVTRSYRKDVAYDRFLQRVLTIGCALHRHEWEELLSYLCRRLKCVCALLATLFAGALACDFYHFGSIYTTLFTFAAYVMPNILVALSLLQYAYGVLLIYKLQQRFNCRLAIRELVPESELLHWIEQCESYYLQLAACIEHITQSFGLLIVTNTFATINVISLQLLEIYQYLQTNDSKPIYIAYNLLWIGMQSVLLVLPLYPNQLLKREVGGDITRVRITHYGMLTLIRKEVCVKACGILTLDLSSVASIFAALLSFVIIMIQFDQTNVNKNPGAVTAFDTLYSSKS